MYLRHIDVCLAKDTQVHAWHRLRRMTELLIEKAGNGTFIALMIGFSKAFEKPFGQP